MRRLPLFLLILLSGTAQSVETPSDAPTPSQAQFRVLLLFPTEMLLPWSLEQAENTKTAIRAAVPHDVQFFAEGQDALRLPGPDHEKEFVALLLKRYQEVPPDLIVLHGPMMDFIRRQRAVLWPGTPIMVASVTTDELQRASLPEDIPGTSVSYDVAGTISLALRLHPEARRLIVVGGSAQWNLDELAYTRQVVEQIRGNLDVQYLVDKTPAEMARDLAAVPRDSVVFQLPIARDHTGTLHTPRVVAERLAKAANAPSYTFYDAGLGLNFVGGSMANWAGQQETIGKIARELLLGETRQASLRMHPPTPSVCRVDWRELRRWQLPVARLPEDCQVYFRELSFWERYRNEAIAIALVLLIQSALIVALILQRHRRRVAELQLSHQRTQLAHAARLAAVGELSASIAHEISQPLAAILTNAEAGELLIKSGNARMEDLLEIMTTIRDDDVRASNVITHMRKLLRHEPNEMRLLDVNDAISSILRLTDGQARLNQVTLQTHLDQHAPRIKGDFVQVQQVLLNLVVNAMDAVAGNPPERRRISITSQERPAGHVEVSVSDSGHGIAAEKLARIFDAFFTTKPNGMGLGLSITRTIVEAHRGKIWAESGEAGSTFRFSIPAGTPSAIS